MLTIIEQWRHKANTKVIILDPLKSYDNRIDEITLKAIKGIQLRTNIACMTVIFSLSQMIIQLDNQGFTQKVIIMAK